MRRGPHLRAGTLVPKADVPGAMLLRCSVCCRRCCRRATVALLTHLDCPAAGAPPGALCLCTSSASSNADSERPDDGGGTCEL